jgi:hypothetical protein
MVLVVLSIVSPASGWRLVGLAGQRVVAITNASRDFCYAATDSVLYRGDRYNWYQPVYRYGSHSDLRVRVKEGQQHTNMPVCLAWGWGSRSDGVWLSTDNGSSWQVETYFLYPCAFDAVWGYYLPQGLMLVGSDTLDNPPLRSTDGGTSWQPCGFGLPGNQVRCFAINGENRRYALCGTRGHGLYLSQDTGATWQFCGPDSSADVLDATWFESRVLVLAKVRDTTAVWSTDYTGRNWARELLLPAGTGLSYNRACQVGGLGIYARDSIWRPDTCGLACRAVRCISSTFFGAFWYAGTDSGVFHLDMTPGAEENPKSQSPRPELQGTIVHGVLFLRADSRLHTGYRAELVDATGRRVLALVAGPNEVQHLAPGVYFVRRASDADCTASGVSRVVIVR